MAWRDIVRQLGEKIQEIAANPEPQQTKGQMEKAPQAWSQSPDGEGGQRKPPRQRVEAVPSEPRPERVRTVEVRTDSPPPKEPLVPENSDKVQWRVRDVQQLLCHIDLLLRFQGFTKLPLQSGTPEMEEVPIENAPDSSPNGQVSPLQKVESMALNDLAEQFTEIVGAGPTGTHLVIVLSTSMTREQLQAVGKQMAEIETQPLLIGDRGGIRYVSQNLETIMPDCDQITFCVNPRDMTPERRMGLQVIQNVLARAINRPVNLNTLYGECFPESARSGPIEPEIVQTKYAGERLMGGPRSRQYGYHR